MSLRDTLAALRALGDENRLRAVLALGNGELCVCQITELLQLAPSTVSKHMSILRQADLVESRKQGRWIYYRLSAGTVAPETVALVQTLRDGLSADPNWERDREELKAILAVDPEELCRRQCRPAKTTEAVVAVTEESCCL